MKLWWVHCEALVAHLMAYQVTGNEEHWRNFTKTWQYTLSKVARHCQHDCLHCEMSLHLVVAVL